MSERIRIIKAVDREVQNNVAPKDEMCVKVRDDELGRRILELRRAYLAFEKFVQDFYGLTLK